MEFISPHMVPLRTSLVMFFLFLLFPLEMTSTTPPPCSPIPSRCHLIADWCPSVSLRPSSLLLQVTATRRRAAPSSTAAMRPPRRASSTTARTWPCLRCATIKTHTRTPLPVHAHAHARAIGREAEQVCSPALPIETKAPTSMDEGN